MKKAVPFLAFVLLLAAILFGGPRLSAVLGKSYRKGVDEHGVGVAAVVYQKKTHKGDKVCFRYRYEGQTYENHEQDKGWFKKLDVGDSIQILLDSTAPGDSYILQMK